MNSRRHHCCGPDGRRTESNSPARRFLAYIHLATILAITTTTTLIQTTLPSSWPAIERRNADLAMASHQRQSDYGIHEVGLKLAKR